MTDFEIKEYRGKIKNCCNKKCKKEFTKGQKVIYGEITEGDGKTIKEEILFCNLGCMFRSGRDDPVYEEDLRIFIGV